MYQFDFLHVPHPEEARGVNLISEGAKALRQSIRRSYGTELTNPRVGFALADLLQDIANAAEAGLLDHVVQRSAIRASAAISEIQAQQSGLTQLAGCGCGRRFRISAAILSLASISCGDCKEEFVICARPECSQVDDFPSNVRAPIRGSMGLNP
jgi:hypothetical protein